MDTAHFVVDYLVSVVALVIVHFAYSDAHNLARLASYFVVLVAAAAVVAATGRLSRLESFDTFEAAWLTIFAASMPALQPHMHAAYSLRSLRLPYLYYFVTVLAQD